MTTRTPARAAWSALAVAALILPPLATGPWAAPAGASTVAPGGGSAAVRSAHFSPDTPAVDVYLAPIGGGTGSVVATSVAYGTIGDYGRLDPGVYTVSMRPAGAAPSTPAVLSWTLDAAPGAAYTAAAIGRNADLQAVVLADDLTPPPTGQGRVRVVQAASSAPSVTVRANGGVELARDLAFGQIAPYRTVPAGTWDVEATTAGGAPVPGTVPVAAGSSSTVAVLDAPSGGMRVLAVQDAGSPGVAPVGAVDAGGGGIAASRIAPQRSTFPPLDAVAISALAVVVLLAGCGARASVPAGSAGSAGSAATGRTAVGTGTPASTLAATPGPPPAPASSPPVALTVPRIGVATGLEDLALLPDGALAAPSRWETAGWYAAGVRPGDAGPAVVAGHVDSTDGPAVFARLAELRRGDEVRVTRADGRTVRFLVDTAVRYPKDRFPTAAVYGPTPTPTLRLVTCTGAFDQDRRSYRDNLVVTAVLAP